jgi:putative membrane protein insertion efficiency factor
MSGVRRVLWVCGTPARAVLIGAIRLYRAALSSSLGGQCRFYPSCSHYAEEAVRVHGAIRGSLMATWRVLRCGPFTQGGLDHVPPASHEVKVYDSVILPSGVDREAR